MALNRHTNSQFLDSVLLASIPLKILHAPGLLLLLCRYLYEREHYNQARQFMQVQKVTLMFASASMLQALIELDTNNQNALDSFLLALEIREGIC